MLSKNQVVAVRKAIEMAYDGRCTVIERKKFRKENKSTGFEDIVVLENQPCKLSFSRIASVQSGETASMVVQTVKLLIAPEIVIEPGSRLDIAQNGTVVSYVKSGQPALFETHQEIILELFEGWA